MAHRNNWRWTILLFAAVGFTESLAFGHLGAFTPLFLRGLSVPENAIAYWTGVLSSVGWIIGLPLLPFWAVWSERYGRKLVIVRSSVFAALMYALVAYSRDVYTLAAARFLGGLVLGNTGVMMAVQADITPRERLGTAMAIVSAGSPVGMAVGPYIGGEIVRAWGMRTLFLLDALLTAAVVLALCIWLREEPRYASRAASTRAGLREVFRAIAHTPSVRLLFGVVFLLAFGVSVSMPYLPLLIEGLYKGTSRDLPRAIGAIITLSGVFMAIATPLWGRLGDRFGYLQATRLCAVVTAIALLGQAYSSDLVGLTVARCVQGAFTAGFASLPTVLLTLYSPPDRRSAILTLSLLPQQLSWFAGPLAGTAMVGWGLAVPFVVGAIVLFVGVAVSLALPRPGAHLSSTDRAPV